VVLGVSGDPHIPLFGERKYFYVRKSQIYCDKNVNIDEWKYFCKSPGFSGRGNGVTEREKEWLKKLEQTLGIHVREGESRPAGQAGIVWELSSGKQVVLCGDWTEREKQLLLLLREAVGGQAHGCRGRDGWLRELIRGSNHGVILREAERVDWKMHALLHMEAKRETNSDGKAGLRELVEAYFGDTGVRLAELDERSWGLLVPIAPSEVEDGMPEEERILQEAEGLAEAMVNERGQEVRLAVHLPVSSPSEVREAWERMVRVMEMERVFDPERRVIPVWRMKLEELLAEIDVERVERYLQETGLMRALRDRETRRTLEAFFRHDLNASEAARHLYIHRNTLLYRLERLKQESGLDVRRFEDAVRVKVALLLRRRLEAEL
jgi:hypothetical protein